MFRRACLQKLDYAKKGLQEFNIFTKITHTEEQMWAAVTHDMFKE